MKSKKAVVLLISILAVTVFSCMAVQRMVFPETPSAVPTSAQKRTPEQLNDGTHTYLMEPTEAGCEASDDSNTAQHKEKTLTFSADYGSVVYGGREYLLVGPHRYRSQNEDGKHLILVLRETGYALEVYRPEDDPDSTPACLISNFTFSE